MLFLNFLRGVVLSSFSNLEKDKNELKQIIHAVLVLNVITHVTLQFATV
jgi:hypothetical protein